MSRHRRWRARKEPKKPFADAFGVIDLWERRCCYSTVTPEFNLTDVVNWLYPPDILALLRQAFRLTDEPHPDMTELINFHLPLPVDVAGEALTVSIEIRMECANARICTPAGGLCVQQEDKHGIVRAILEHHRIVQEWNLVRDVVQWFNDNATPACARYYFPAMGNFLPKDHEFHTKTGIRYTEPKQSIGLIAPKVRRAAEIITMALFCPHSETTAESTGVFLTILGNTTTHDTGKRSQTFFF